MNALSDSVTKTIAAGAGHREILYVVIHTAGAPKGVDQSAASIRAYHMQHNGWRDIGYNFVVRKDGLVETGRSLAVTPAHASGFNTRSLGICFTGNGDLSDFTLAQYDSGLELVEALQGRFSVPTRCVIGHREVTQFGAPNPGKTCPGLKVDMADFRARLGGA
jgi:N-acetylmuramoyl-L-alanine amidase